MVVGKLVLSDGTTFEGRCFGAEKNVAGEAVFQTGMCGYVESLTDPSYRGQILCLTYPLIGNYGVPPETRDEYRILKYFESESIHAAALIVGDYTEDYSHWNAVKSLGKWLKENNIVALEGIDTRALTMKLRESGSMLAKIVITDDKLGFENPNERNLVREVVSATPVTYGIGDHHIVAVDCGFKSNQLRCLLKRNVRVTLVPYDYDWTENLQYDGVFVSNGPGDPTMVTEVVEKLRKDLKGSKPIFGICLGHQLLSLAAGAKTYKMKYGNRGHNQPCIDTTTGRCHITMQNHGFAVDTDTLPAPWKEYFRNANDGSNEGIYHPDKPFFSVQFHPEARGGPRDTEFLFDKFVALVRGESYVGPMVTPVPVQPVRSRKVLVLGSGGLSIGQAGEFDYSGSQCLKALREEGVRTVLINPNVATVQTSPGVADVLYFVPVTPDFVEKVIRDEKPDGLLCQFGGQTALNCAIELYKDGIFEKYNVEVLGTPIEAIIATEDRDLFSEKLREIGEKMAQSASATTVEEALHAARAIGYPVIVRAAYALGGLGSGFAEDDASMVELVTKALSSSSQVLVEKSMKGWKEIEYEVVRDAADNCITVCNMENFDPLGVHTGESIVVSPSQTLTDYEYQMLRSTAIKVVRHLGVVGECNIQYALDPSSLEYCIIEVNARLSRSSALASKATGYPLAFVAAKLSLGATLPTIKNAVTKDTTACFEPSLDYCVVKVPRWDLKKFNRVSLQIGSAMKSVGEVMAIGRRFEETMQKALRMVDEGNDGFCPGHKFDDTILQNPISDRVHCLATALYEGYDVAKLHSLTRIDRWFLRKLHNIIEMQKHLESLGSLHNLTAEVLKEAKQLGFSDKMIGRCLKTTESAVRARREEDGVRPIVKRIDTVAGEFPATTNYLYVTYGSAVQHDDCITSERSPSVQREGSHGSSSVIVLGSGVYRIGSSVEFDWCGVGCVRTLRKMGIKATMINYNPETVSTDFDECDRLYFEELSVERVLDIYNLEWPMGVVVSMGGQASNNIAMSLHRKRVRILGTTPEMIDSAENRYKFSRLLDRMNVDQPQWREVTDIDSARDFCHCIGYPCLIRPSYVLSGAAMNVAYSDEELENYLNEAAAVSRDHPVVISKFISYAKEIEVDAVARDGELVMHAVSEHVENAGVHSGDATLVLPAQDLEPATVQRVENVARQIARALNVTGPLNFQFIAKDNKIKVIECNLRASRSFPFVSKTLGVDMIEIATKVIMGAPFEPYPVKTSDLKHVGVKVSQFSFTRLQGADPVLGVEMASTGEVGCFGANRYEAYLKALRATNFVIPRQRILLSIGQFREKMEFLESARRLVDMGFELLGTPGTADFIQEHNIPCKPVDWPDVAGKDEYNIVKQLKVKNIDLIVNIPSNSFYRRSASYISPGYIVRRTAVDFQVPLITNIKCAKMLVQAFDKLQLFGRKRQGDPLPLRPYDWRSAHRLVRLPGLIDIGFNIHCDASGQWEKQSAAALAGGFTQVCGVEVGVETDDAASFKRALEAANAESRCDFSMYVTATESNSMSLPDVGELSAGMKMYLNRLEPWGGKDRPEDASRRGRLAKMTEHFQRWPASLPLVVHAEGRDLAAAILQAVLANRSVHVSRVSREEEIELIRQAKARSLPVTCDVAIHHLVLTEEDTASLGKAVARVNPRLATRRDRDALWANMDIIDCICSDHIAVTKAQKAADGVFGFPGAETMIPLLLTAVSEGRMSLDDLIARVSTNPRRIFGLMEQSETFVEVDLDASQVISDSCRDGLGSVCECGWSPYAGLRVSGSVVRVVVDGEIRYLDGKVYAPPGCGRNIRARRPPTLPPLEPAAPRLPTQLLLQQPGSPRTVTVRPQPKVGEEMTGLSESTLTPIAPGTPTSVTSRPAGSAPTISPIPSPMLSPAQITKSVPVPLPEPGLASLPHAEEEPENTVPTNERKLRRPSNSRMFLSRFPFDDATTLSSRLPGRTIVSVKQFNRDQLHALYAVADDMSQIVARVGCLDILKGKVLALLFYEPSTRTMGSFQAAMQRLGGTCLPLVDPERVSSAAKGESLEDTVMSMESYADACVIRHRDSEALLRASGRSRKPFISAGDGTGEHPTQALLDVYTIRQELGSVNGLTVTFVGDLKHGRTVHSTARLLSLYKVTINYVAPEGLGMPAEAMSFIADRGVEQHETSRLEDVLPKTNVLYVTRLQRERFEDPADYARYRDSYAVTPETLTHAPSDMIIMHPLPRVGEISPEVDSDPRAVYFRQMEYGMYTRMALLAIMMGKA